MAPKTKNQKKTLEANKARKMNAKKRREKKALFSLAQATQLPDSPRKKAKSRFTEEERKERARESSRKSYAKRRDKCNACLIRSPP